MENRGSETGAHVPLVVHLPIWKGTFEVSKRRKKYVYTLFISDYLYYVNLSEPFHVTNGVRPGEVLRPYFFAVYLDDLFLEPSNIKAVYYIG